jgi:hypothetical protein
MDIIHFTTPAVEAIEKYKQTLQIPVNHFLRVGIRQKNETNKRFIRVNARDLKGKFH